MVIDIVCKKKKSKKIKHTSRWNDKFYLYNKSLLSIYSKMKKVKRHLLYTAINYNI